MKPEIILAAIAIVVAMLAFLRRGARANGETGDKGEKGDAGPPGAPGRDGVDGKDGRDGVDAQSGTPFDREALIQEVLGRISIPEPPPAVDVVAMLASLNIHVRRNKLSVGVLPKEDCNSAIDIGGEAAAVILGVSNSTADYQPTGTDKQNPGEIHISGEVISDNDGGKRWWHYGYWNKLGQRVRNTTNRPFTAVALDSYGDLCVSDDRVAFGQVFYLVKRVAEGIIDLCTYRTDFRIRVRRSSVRAGFETAPESFDKGYSSCDVDVIEETVRRILAEKGL